MGIQIMRQEPGRPPALHAGYDSINVGVAVGFMEQAAGQECARRQDAHSVMRADTMKDGLRHYRRNVVGAEPQAQTLATYFLAFDGLLWIRLGDGDDYHAFDDVSEAAEHLSEFGSVQAVERLNDYGVSAHGFRGNNYISIFWGDSEAQPTRGLTVDEFAELNSALEKANA